VILSAASRVGVFPNVSSAEERGGRAGDIRTGGDMPAGRPSNESSILASCASIYPKGREEALRRDGDWLRLRRRGVTGEE